MAPLIVRPPWAAHAPWTGTWLSSPGSTAPPTLMHWAQAQDLPACDELVLALPASRLSWHRVNLPKLAPGRWRAALEGLLEDRLLAEPTELHLALSPEARGGQEVQVAACDKAWLGQTLQALEQAGRSVSRMVPEFEPDGSGLHLLGSAESGLLVDCGSDAVHCLALGHPAQAQLQAWRALGAAGPVRAEPAWAQVAEKLWGAPHLLHPGAHLQAAAQSRWNLAQFEFAGRSGKHQRLARQLRQVWREPAWRPVRWGLAGMLAVHLLGLQAWAWQEGRHQAALQAQMQAIFSASFPQTRVVIDPALQMAREVQALARAAGQGADADLPRLLAALASLETEPPRSLDYQAGELTLTGWQPAQASVPAWQARLASQGLRLALREGQWRLAANSGSAP